MIQICLPLPGSDGAVRKFYRPRDEPLEKTLKRIAKTVSDQTSFSATLLDAAGVPLDGSVALCQAFIHGPLAVALTAGGYQYCLRVNRPEIKSVDCRSEPIVGMPLIPFAEGRFCSTEEMRWEWVRTSDGSVVGRERLYTPQDGDLGSKLRVMVRPPIMGGAGAAQWESAVPVAPALPDVGWSVTRSVALGALSAARRRPGEEVFRVVSYNVLADAYRHCWADMFPYCDPQAYRPEVRLQRCRQEIAAYRSDVVCLQEVDARWFREYWAPQFEAEGYESRYTQKVRGSEEGCALFVRAAALELLDFRELPLNSRPLQAEAAGIVAGDAPVEAAVRARLEGDAGLEELWRRLGTVAQLALVRCRAGPRRLLLVCNTHLYFANMARHVRIMQAALILEAAHKMAAAAAAQWGARPALLFCGDLNSAPETGAAQLLLRGGLSAGHGDWAACAPFHWGFGSSRAASQVLAAALREADSEAAFGALVARGTPEEESLRDSLERLQRMRLCLQLLVGGSEAAMEGVERSDAEEEQPRKLDLGAGWAPGGGGSAYVVLAEALAAGGTFKNSRVVASAQLALDARLSSAPTAALDASQLHRAAEVAAALAEATAARIQQAAERQRALAAAAEAAAPPAGSQDLPAFGASLHGVGLELRHPFRLASAYEETPEFTNFVAGYEATLDWILFEEGPLRRVASAPLPPRSMVEEETALPSWRFPSDHLLLAADLAWSGSAVGNGDG